MFALLFERRDRVMLTRYSRMYSWDDISEIDAFLASFVTEHGYVRIILDFTDVETIAISRQRLLARGKKIRTNPSQARVIVAPPEREIYELYCDYAQDQLAIGNGEMKIVHALTEAFNLLGMQNPQFEPLISGGHDRR
jgi:hypothetical protein